MVKTKFEIKVFYRKEYFFKSEAEYIHIFFLMSKS